jgi:hypothetical protein
MSGCLLAVLIGMAVAAVLGLGSCAVLVATMSSADDEREQERQREWADVDPPTCRLEGLGFLAADLAVTNHSSERSNYAITVAFEDAGGAQIHAASAFVEALEPGQSTTAQVGTLTRPPDGEAFTCRTVTVDRASDET